MHIHIHNAHTHTQCTYTYTMHIHIHNAHTYTHTYTHIHTHTHTHTHTYTYTKSTHTYIYIHTPQWRDIQGSVRVESGVSLRKAGECVIENACASKRKGTYECASKRRYCPQQRVRTRDSEEPSAHTHTYMHTPTHLSHPPTHSLSQHNKRVENCAEEPTRTGSSRLQVCE
jgi:hypothetical protein